MEGKQDQEVQEVQEVQEPGQRDAAESSTRPTRPDGIVRAGGKKSGELVGIVYKGVEYTIGMEAKDFEEVEKFLLSKRLNPIVAIKDELEQAKDNPKLQDMLVKLAYDDMRKHKTVDLISMAEVKAYLDTREGSVRSVWMSLRKRIPELTLEKTAEIMDEVITEEILRARDEASKKLIDEVGV